MINKSFYHFYRSLPIRDDHHLVIAKQHLYVYTQVSNLTYIYMTHTKVNTVTEFLY